MMQEEEQVQQLMGEKQKSKLNGSPKNSMDANELYSISRRIVPPSYSGYLGISFLWRACLVACLHACVRANTEAD